MASAVSCRFGSDSYSSPQVHDSRICHFISCSIMSARKDVYERSKDWFNGGGVVLRNANAPQAFSKHSGAILAARIVEAEIVFGYQIPLAILTRFTMTMSTT